MSQSYEIEKPYTLFTLSPPHDETDGKTTTAQAYSIGGSKKRKAPEIAVGVDGEAINVYNVKQPKLVCSHPIPLQAYLTAPPCSVRCKGDSTAASFRFTYAALRDGFSSSSFSLQCFKDDASIAKEADTVSKAKQSNFTVDIGLQSNPVTFIEVSPSSEPNQKNSRHTVVAVQKDGNITGFSEDLQSKLWETKATEVALNTTGTKRSASVVVEATFLYSAAFVTEKFLPQRPDISAVMDGTDEKSKQGSVLILVTKTTEENAQSSHVRQLELLYLRSKISGFSQRRFTEPLISWSLPDSATTFPNSTTSLQYAVDEGAGHLQVIVEDSLLVYEFSGMNPRLFSKMPLVIEPNSTFIPICPTLLLMSSQNHAIISNVQYSSTLATQTFAGTLANDRRKRKRSDSNADSSISHVKLGCYFPDLTLAVGLSGSKLVGLQIRFPAAKKSATNHQRIPRLIDSLGMNYKETARKSDPADQTWSDTIATLRELASEQNTQEYEEKFFQAVQSCHEQSTERSKLQQLALAALGHIFEWNATTKGFPHRDLNPPCAIKIAFLPSNVFEWLTKANEAVAERIERALHQTKPFVGALRSVTPEELVKSLATHDPSLVTLSRYFTQSTWIALPGVVASFKCLIESFDTPPLASEARLLTDSDTAMDSAQDDDQDVLAEEEAAQRELAIATSFLHDGIALRAAALKSCLEKLGTCYPPRALSAALRSQLSRRDLVLLIELLRIELSEGGWTSRALDISPGAAHAAEQRDEAIAVITALLSGAIDALGAGGWLDDDGQLVTDLRGEAAAVLEGVQEAAFFSGFLREFLRFEAALGGGAQRRAYRRALGAAESVVLPFGTDGVGKVSETRVAQGGEVKERSKRDVGQRISRRVGKYSFERIRV